MGKQIHQGRGRFRRGGVRSFCLIFILLIYSCARYILGLPFFFSHLRGQSVFISFEIVFTLAMYQK